MIVRLGTLEFDDVSYDADGDVLYLSDGKPVAAKETIASPEGHAIRFGKGEKIIGITIVNAKWLVERDGQITVTIPTTASAPERLETSGADLAAALAA
jgi:uncharacterized protein YuzE